MSGEARFVPSGKVRGGAIVWLLALLVAVFAGSCSSLESEDTTTTELGLAAATTTASGETPAAPSTAGPTTTASPSTPSTDESTTTTSGFLPILQAEINLEALLVPLSWTRYENDDLHMSWMGSWSTGFGAKFSGNSYRSVNTSHAGLVVTFTGTQIQLVCMTNTAQGKVELKLDYDEPVMVDLYSSPADYQKIVWTSDLLDNENHTLLIGWTGLKHPSSSNTFINVDAIEVKGTLID